VRIFGEAIPRGARDADWLAAIGKENWICLTKDKHIRRRLAERNALLAARVRAFVLTSGNLTGAEMAEIFASNVRRIERFARRTKPPFIAKITRNGVIEEYPDIT
jgi:predicted nuclease of predicted toxin-antitoxin system